MADKKDLGGKWVCTVTEMSKKFFWQYTDPKF